MSGKPSPEALGQGSVAHRAAELWHLPRRLPSLRVRLPRGPLAQYLGALSLFVAVYCVTGELGLLTGNRYTGLTPLWPPAGVALFMVLVAGSRMWPGIVLGTLILGYAHETPALTACLAAVAYVLEALLACHLLARAHFDVRMQRLKDVLALSGLGALVAAMIGALLGSLGIVMGGVAAWEQLPMLWVTWWLGDAMGILVITPFLLAWREWRGLRPSRKQAVELGLLVGVLIAAAWLNFQLVATRELNTPLLLYLIAPLGVWAAIRFQMYGATLVAFVVTVILLLSTGRGYGAFAAYTSFNSLLLNIFEIAVTSFMVLSVAALFAERKATESALHTSRERYRSLVNSMNEGLGVQDEHGVLSYVNDRLCEILGFSRAELVGHPWPQRLDARARPAGRTRRDADGLDLTDPYEFEFLRKDGRTVCLQASPQQIVDAQGSVTGSFSVYTDITRRKRIETILGGRRRVLEELARGASLESVLMAVVETAQEARPDIRCAVMLLDSKGERLGYGAAPSLPESYKSATDGVDIRVDGDICARVAREGRRQLVYDMSSALTPVELRRLAEQAGVRACWAEPIVSSGGDMLGVLAMYYRQHHGPEEREHTFIQVTANLAGIAIESTRRAEALAQSETRFRQLAEHIRDVFWVVDADGSFGYVSPAYEQIWGRSRETLKNDPQDWLRAVHPEDRKRIHPVTSGTVPEIEHREQYRVVQPDGAVRWVRDRQFPIRDEAGVLRRVVGVAEDITEQKRAEEQARAHQDELAHMARLSTVGEMASSLAHELNQPLGAVTNYCSAGLRLLRARPGYYPERLTHALEQAATQAQRAGEIIRHLRGFVRKDARPKACVDVNELVRETLNLVATEVRRKQGVLRLELAEDLPKVYAERVQIEQVILNLMRNALEAMLESSTRRRQHTLTLRTTSRKAQSVQVTVRDTGPGIDEDTLARLFEPFFTRKPDGMGMGLPISRSIIEAHGGRLWAEKVARPRGTAFHFSLPAGEECNS